MNLIGFIGNEDNNRKNIVKGFVEMDINLEKGKKMPIGTVSHGYKKVSEGKWEKVKNKEDKFKKPSSSKVNDILDSIENREGNYKKLFPEVDPKVIDIILDAWENREERKITSRINQYYKS